MATKRRRFTAEFKARVAITGLHDLPRLQVVVPTRRSAKPVNTSSWDDARDARASTTLTAGSPHGS